MFVKTRLRRKESNMNILQINTVYPGGSTGQITHNLHRALIEEGHSSTVVYGRGPNAKLPEAVRLCSNRYGQINSVLSRITGLRYGGCKFSTAKLFSYIENNRPDLVHLQCINGYFVNIYELLTWLGEHKIPTVLTLHAEFMYTANCSYANECDRWVNGCGSCPRLREATKSVFGDKTALSWRKMEWAYESLRGNAILVPVSPWVESRVRRSKMLRGIPVQTVLNGVDTNIFRPVDAENLRKKLLGEYKGIVFHATAFFSDERAHAKGGWHILALAKSMPEVLFVVAGQHGKIEDLPENVKLLGLVRDQHQLAKMYSVADISVIASKRETFSMPCAESLCCGTPVVGYQSGAPEMIALQKYSKFVPYGAVNNLRKLIDKWLTAEVKQNYMEQIAVEAGEMYSVQKMTDSYLKIYRKMIAGPG